MVNVVLFLQFRGQNLHEMASSPAIRWQVSHGYMYRNMSRSGVMLTNCLIVITVKYTHFVFNIEEKVHVVWKYKSPSTLG